MGDLLQTNELPLATWDLPPVFGKIKEQPEDFEVEEIPAYEPSGHGEFLYLWIEKRDLSGPFLARALGRAFGISDRDIGMAGLKDRRAVTRQWVSLPGSVEGVLGELAIPGLKILKVSRHENKLRVGHLHGNRFQIFLRTQEKPDQEKMDRLMERLRKKGLWNFYGEQRFGKGKETLQDGLNLFFGKGERRIPGQLRKLAFSALQSALFNEVLRVRVSLGVDGTVLPGDVLAFLPQEKCCQSRDLPLDQARVDQGEMAITGPMPGWKMYPAPKADALDLENRVQASFGFSPDGWRKAGSLMTGARRVLRYPIRDLSWTADPGGYRLAFSLPAGAYATRLIREITHEEEGQPGGD